MSDEQLKKAKGPIIHVPGTMGAVVMTYNFEGLKEPLKFTGTIIADIFLGRINKWSDPRITALNPELKAVLGNTEPDILVVHRADGSGTTSIFSEVLSKSSDEWKSKVGKGTALRWPTGIGGKGNEGVTSFIKQIPGAIGYVELVFAKTLKLPVASVENPMHEFVEPSATTVTKAAEGALSHIPDDFRYSLTNVLASQAYPISSFTYLLVYDKMEKGPKRDALFRFIRWGLDIGQGMSEKLNYAPLPAPLVARIVKRLDQSDAELSRGQTP